MFILVFFQRAVMCTLIWLGRSGACHWTKLGNACGVGWPIESLLNLDCSARPVAQKGVVVWDFLTISWEGSIAFATATRIRIEPDHPHEHPTLL